MSTNELEKMNENLTIAKHHRLTAPPANESATRYLYRYLIVPACGA